MGEAIKKAAWNETERALLNGLLDEIIPASTDGQLPGAGALGVADFLARQIEEVPGLATLFDRGLKAAATLIEKRGGDYFHSLATEEREAVAKALEKSEPAFFSTLVRHTYIGYYTNPIVPPYYGLSDKPPQPDGYDLPADDPEELAKLVEPVRKRGKCYREC